VFELERRHYQSGRHVHPAPPGVSIWNSEIRPFLALGIGKFDGIRVKTEGEQTATFGVFAAIGVGRQTINQVAYSAALDPAGTSVWQLLNRFWTRLTVMSE